MTAPACHLTLKLPIVAPVDNTFTRANVGFWICNTAVGSMQLVEEELEVLVGVLLLVTR